MKDQEYRSTGVLEFWSSGVLEAAAPFTAESNANGIAVAIDRWKSELIPRRETSAVGD
jgi:hypothetical protein